MEIVCLIDNQKKDPNLESEHGLALWVVNGDFRILFDTGATGKLVENAVKLGVSLEKVDLAIISHGHRDHGGGLESFLKLNPTAPVYMNRGAGKKHIKMDKGSFKDISLDEDVLENYANRIHFLSGPVQLTENLHILTSIKQNHDVPDGNQLLYEVSGTKLVPDNFSHELVMVVEKEDGLVVFTGCSHKGILNILGTVMEHFPDTPLLTVFGGLHLMIPPDDSTIHPVKLEMMAGQLENYPLGRIYTGHCTGTSNYHFLKRIMADRIEYFATGSRVVL
ncbi:MAG: MBL fold metallo-hydrolase [Methanobacteriaceae archaeon]